MRESASTGDGFKPAAAATLLAVAALAAGTWFALPLLARRAADRVPAVIEEQIGSAALSTLSQTFPRAGHDGEREAAVRAQMGRLEKGRPAGRPIRIVFLTMGTPTALALPGGAVVISRELLDLRPSSDEVAAILAREIGHEELRHGLRSVFQGSATLAIVSALTGDFSAAVTSGAALPQLLIQRGYSRDLEAEADAYAIGILKASGIDPRALAVALLRLRQSAPPEKAGADGYISTHPDIGSRVEAAGGSFLSIDRSDAETRAGDNDRLLDVLHAGLIHYNRAISANPFNPDAWSGRGALRLRSRDYAGSATDWHRAIALRLGPAPAEWHAARAEALEGARDWAGAVAACDLGLRLYPRNTRFLALRSRALLGRQDLGSAIESANAAIAAAAPLARLNAAAAGAHAARAQEENRQGRFEEAETDAGRAIDGAPDMAAFWSLRARIRIHRDDLEGAKWDLEQAVLHDPTLSGVFRQRGQLEEMTGDFRAAQRDYAENVKREPGDLYGRFLWALTLRRSGLPDTQAGLAMAPAANPKDGLVGGGWPEAVRRFLCGGLPEREFLAAAAAVDGSDAGTASCEADYYAARIHLLKGETADARRLLEACVTATASGWAEIDLARAELRRMNRDHGPRLGAMEPDSGARN